MPRENPKRKQWNIALAMAGTTTGRVAKQFRVSRSALNGVLAGKITSAPLTAKIDAFLRRHLPESEQAA